MSDCTCADAKVDGSVYYCPACHLYQRNGSKLDSVTSIIRACWPIKKNFEDANQDVLEHARERGVRIDRYFTEYLRTGETRIQVGEWQEVKVGLLAVIDWWRTEVRDDAQAQVILADDSVAGTADIVYKGTVVDLKCVSALDPSYEVQVGGYAQLKGDIEQGLLLHCKIDARAMTAKVKPVEVNLKQAVEDWRLIRSVWEIGKRQWNAKAKRA